VRRNLRVVYEPAPQYGEWSAAAGQQAATAGGRTLDQIAEGPAESHERRTRQAKQAKRQKRALKGLLGTPGHDAPGGAHAAWTSGWGGEQLVGATSPALFGQLEARRPGSVFNLAWAGEKLARNGESLSAADYAAFGHHLRQVPLPWHEGLGGSRAQHLATRRVADVYHARFGD
jgi:hypothetical protein